MPIRYELRYVMLRKIKDGNDPFPDIQGREKTKRDLIRAVLSNSHPYLVSREGTGKTRLAESLAKLLPPVPKVKGCPYNCDPKWPPEWQCPSCREEKDPNIEIITGKQRYSRIQGNEYTNEAKILGVKDIQAIVQGGSPTDPRAFIGTGILRGNRGVITVDELPAIPTKVQVLFHPMLQENKIILEEYAWERPIDIFFIATGNPTGFAHVNRIPEPLLDRLELIPMDLPEEPVEREIMFRERFNVYDKFFIEDVRETYQEPLYVTPESLKRKVIAPWWIVETIVKTTRYTRDCPNIDRGASIRGSIKALDHTYSTTEMRRGRVSNLKDAAEGLNLSLRGRIRLRADLIGFDESEASLMNQTARVIEDVFWYAIRDVGEFVLVGLENDQKELTLEIVEIFRKGGKILDNLESYPILFNALYLMHELGPEGAENKEYNPNEQLNNITECMEPETLEEYWFSALELIFNTLIAKELLKTPPGMTDFYIAQRIES